MRLFGLIGYPLSHSFSQKYFTEKFEREGLTDCRYELFPIKSVYELKEILQQNPELEGLNVTIPYKQLIWRHLHSSINIPEGLSGCNCIKIKKGVLNGYNTDIIGFEKSFVQPLRKIHKRALVLGNGGTANAIIFVLKKLGIQYDMVSRKIHDGSTLTYHDLNEKRIKENLIIIHATPLGTFPDIESCPDIPYQFISDKHYLFDVVYNPAKTLFLQKGEEKGAVIKNGYEMLVIQAEESWRIWNEVEADK